MITSCFFNIRIASNSFWVSLAARADVGSSSISTFGLKLMALVISTTWHCHILSLNTFSWGSISTPIACSSSPAI